jgi:hypothetical protein
MFLPYTSPIAIIMFLPYTLSILTITMFLPYTSLILAITIFLPYTSPILSCYFIILIADLNNTLAKKPPL